jgi:hypothetical protein
VATREGCDPDRRPWYVEITRMAPSTKDLLDRAAQLVRERGGSVVLSAEERVDWAFGNAVIENQRITRELVQRAADERAAE